MISSIKAPNHCLFHLLSLRIPLHQTLRAIGHGFELPSYNYKLHKQSNDSWELLYFTAVLSLFFYRNSNLTDRGAAPSKVYQMFSPRSTTKKMTQAFCASLP